MDEMGRASFDLTQPGHQMFGSAKDLDFGLPFFYRVVCPACFLPLPGRLWRCDIWFCSESMARTQLCGSVPCSAS